MPARRCAAVVWQAITDPGAPPNNPPSWLRRRRVLCALGSAAAFLALVTSLYASNKGIDAMPRTPGRVLPGVRMRRSPTGAQSVPGSGQRVCKR